MSRRLVRVLPDGIELATGGFIPMTDHEAVASRARDAVLMSAINWVRPYAAITALEELHEAHGALEETKEALALEQEVDDEWIVYAHQLHVQRRTAQSRYDAAVAAIMPEQLCTCPPNWITPFGVDDPKREVPSSNHDVGCPRHVAAIEKSDDV